jgi:hypothetical protein
MENEIQQNNPPIQPLPQTPTPIPTQLPTNWSKILLFTVLGLIIVAGSVFTGIQIGKNQIPSQQPIVTQPIITSTQGVTNPTTSPTIINPTINPTSDLKTYTNTKYSYIFQYPQQYNVKNNIAEGYDNNIATSGQLEVFNPNGEPTLVFAVNAEQTSQDFATYADTIFTTISTFKFPQSDKDYKNPLGSIEDNSVIAPIKKEIINNISAYTFTIRGNFIGTAGLPTKNPLTIKYVLFNSKGTMFILKVLNPSTDTNLLLNSFKFTN